MSRLLHDAAGPVVVNDVHSRLNETRVAEVRPVDSLPSLRAASRGSGARIPSGGRHAMGGQQLVAGGMVVDTRSMCRVLGFDRERGLIEVEAGIQWPELVGHLVRSQDGAAGGWGIAQKQTGANRFTVGGSISANCHGRGLAMRPIVDDVESFRLVRPDGAIVTCSREEHTELFRLVIGGYGLFGAVYSVVLRLAPRRKLERVVELTTTDELVRAFPQRIAEGFTYGDFQFAIDAGSADFLRRGVLSCYRPVEDDRPIPSHQRALSRWDWDVLLRLAHREKTRAFEEYARHYLATSGQLYWSDLHQLADYVDGYHARLDAAFGAAHPATEMIGELYVPRARLHDFLAEAAHELRRLDADVVYGTIRLIERDEESFLAWAKQAYACVIFNLHTVHTEAGIRRSAAVFRRLIDLSVDRDGSYFLTYHRWASREQVLACYPQFAEFLRLKRRHDPDERVQSDWYRHHVQLLADQL